MALTALASSLPAELIVEEILSRLPVKSMVRFRSVCKLWNSLFYDSKFIQNHFNRNSCISPKDDNDDYLILWEHADLNPRSLIILSQYNFFETTFNEPPYYFRELVEDNIILVGSMNGLVCIADFKYYIFILWNPAIHWFKKILPPNNQMMVMRYMLGFGNSWANDDILESCWHSLTNDYMIGFGWDSSGNDYKLIAKHSPSETTFVYSCKTDNWSEQKVIDFRVTDYQQFPCVMVRGVPYWKSWSHHRYDQVLKFDVTNNQFIILDIPNFIDVENSTSSNYSLINLYDCLALVEYDYNSGGAYLYRFDDDEQNSTWSKLYKIETTKPPMSTFTKDVGEIVLNGINNYTPTMLALEGMKPVVGQLDDVMMHGLASYIIQYFDDSI